MEERGEASMDPIRRAKWEAGEKNMKTGQYEADEVWEDDREMDRWQVDGGRTSFVNVTSLPLSLPRDTRPAGKANEPASHREFLSFRFICAVRPRETKEEGDGSEARWRLLKPKRGETMCDGSDGQRAGVTDGEVKLQVMAFAPLFTSLWHRDGDSTRAL